MRSSKSRSRSKSNRSKGTPGGNVVNRVFDSSGPEGTVRGTPQQIIDKYNQLARDAQLGNDRVATENFQQHAEHYLRMLSQAQREIDQRREEQERQNRERQAERDRERAERQDRDQPEPSEQSEQPEVVEPVKMVEEPSVQPDVLEVADTGSSEEDSGLVETPESAPKKPARRTSTRTRKPAKSASKTETPSEDSGAPEAAE